MKTLNENTLTGYKLARRLTGQTPQKRVICPGCGRVHGMDALDFELLTLDGKVKEITSPKADGVQWCDLCR